jgi:nucleoside-diphosphate-sugar epimerase
VVVTGANEGIGSHLLSALADEGYRVAGFDVDVENLRSLAEARPDRSPAVRVRTSEVPKSTAAS